MIGLTVVAILWLIVVFTDEHRKLLRCRECGSEYMLHMYVRKTKELVATRCLECGHRQARP